MGTIHEFPQWRAQRSLPAETGFDAQVVIFPGVRIERGGETASKPVPRPASPANSSSDGGRQSR